MKKEDIDTVAISKFEPVLLCVQNCTGFSSSNRRVCEAAKGHRAHGLQDIKGLKEISSIQLLINVKRVDTVTIYVLNLK